MPDPKGPQSPMRRFAAAAIAAALTTAVALATTSGAVATVAGYRWG